MVHTCMWCYRAQQGGWVTLVVGSGTRAFNSGGALVKLDRLHHAGSSRAQRRLGLSYQALLGVKRALQHPRLIPPSQVSARIARP